MQINQQICRKMEELDKMDKNSPDISKVCELKELSHGILSYFGHEQNYL